jgi:2-(1,2-epoxy-1,2-dihydrophenyl)acetyl-CoA isomerase
MSHPITVTRSGSIATVTLTRPGKKNAINLEMTRALRDATQILEHDADLGLIVLTAQGSAFSVGGDIDEFVDVGSRISEHLHSMTDSLHAAVLSLRRAHAPVLAIVNGVAAGGGLGLMLTADVVIATRSARFTSAYTKIGMTPDSGVTYFLPRRIGVGRAFEMIATNRIVSADEAQAIGLIDRVVDDDRFVDDARQLASQLASTPSHAIGIVKHLMSESELAELETRLAREAARIAAIAAKPETQDKLLEFKKRK